MPPSGVPLSMLEELDRYGRADADTALAAVETLDKVISYTQAMQMRFMDRFTNARPAVGAPFSKYAAGEIAASLTWSLSAAQKRLNLAYQLVHELPGTMARMSAGYLDLRKAFTFADQVGHLSPEDAQKVEEKVLPDSDSKTPRSIRDRARREVIKIDPAAAEARRKKLVSERRVEKQPCEDGMALLSARSCPPNQPKRSTASSTPSPAASKPKTKPAPWTHSEPTPSASASPAMYAPKSNSASTPPP